MKSISAKDFYRDKRQKSGFILDVRSKDEFLAQRLVPSENIPLDHLEDSLKLIPKDQDIYLMCRSGRRSQVAAKKLSQLGYEKTFVVEGGLQACEKQKIPIYKNGYGISINRQVQMAVGFLVLMGIILGFFVHSGFFLLSGAVALGLFLAGVTGFCGLAILLEKMPWNRAMSCKNAILGN